MSPLIHDPFTRFIVQALLIIVVSRLLGLVTRKLGQPQVIAEITAGIVLGPSLLGALVPGATARLFPPESLGLLGFASQLGLVLFMFLIGLELDPKQFRGLGRVSVSISQAGILVPFAFGGVLAFWFHPLLSPPGVPFLAFMLFLGVAMSITAFPVLARILGERRMLGTRVGAIALASAAVNDVTAWCLLAFVVAAARVSSPIGAITTLVATVVYVAGMLWVVRPLLARLAVRVPGRDGLTQNLVATTLLLLLLSAFATELIGIHALFGAFLFGVILPKQSGLGRALADKLEDLVLVLFLPLFFALSGVRTEVGLLTTLEDWAVTLVALVVACLGKFGGTTLAARFSGLDWRRASALGILMNTRGLMELIVLNIGLELGVISPKLFTIMVIVALATTFMTSPLLAWVYPHSAVLRDSPMPARIETPLPAKLRAAYDVLVCVAHGRSGPGLVTLAAALSGNDRVRIRALHLLNASDRASFFVDSSDKEANQAILKPLIERAHELGADVRPQSFVSNDPAKDICEVARNGRTDLILIGWHKPVFSQTFLGGTVHGVLRDAPSNVGVFVDRGLERVERVLVPFVGSVHDRVAIQLARRILGRGTGEVTLLHVRAAPEPRRDSDEITNEPEGGRVILRVVHHPSPIDAVLAEMANGYDLVLVGAGREWGLEQRLLGVQRERLVVESKISLLIVRARVGGEAPALESTPVLSPA